MSWYGMNQAMADLHLAANRELFGSTPDDYLARYDLTDEERTALNKSADAVKELVEKLKIAA